METKIQDIVGKMNFFPVVLIVVYVLAFMHRAFEWARHDKEVYDSMAFASLKLQVG